MIKHGTAPFLECSSLGDKRFSAFYARPKSLKGRSIEWAYQSMKVLPDGRTGLGHEAKGQRAVNQRECNAAYARWWREWVKEQDLLPVLRAATGLSDIFGLPGRICQATTLWELRNGTTPNVDQYAERL